MDFGGFMDLRAGTAPFARRRGREDPTAPEVAQRAQRAVTRGGDSGIGPNESMDNSFSSEVFESEITPRNLDRTSKGPFSPLLPTPLLFRCPSLPRSI